MAEEVSGNIYLRKWRGMPKGKVIEGHKHNFDHTTIVFIGAVHVKAKLPDGRVMAKDVQAPDHFLVAADVEHEITALREGTELWCVYAHREPQSADVVQKYTGWGPAYLHRDPTRVEAELVRRGVERLKQYLVLSAHGVANEAHLVDTVRNILSDAGH